MKNEEALLIRVCNFIEQAKSDLDLNHVKVEKDTSLTRDLGMDSLAQVELLNRMEKEFAVSISPDDFEKLDTPRDLVKIICHATKKVDTSRPERSLSQKKKHPEQLEQDPQSLQDLLRMRAKQTPEQVCLHIYKDEIGYIPINYNKLWKQSLVMASSLAAKGVKKGDRIAIMLPTGINYFYSYLGVLLAGAIPVPVYPPLKKSQLKEHLKRHVKIFNNCMATGLIASKEMTIFNQGLKKKFELYHG